MIPLVIGAGMALGAAGGMLGASAKNRAARRAEDDYDMRTQEYGGRLFDLFYGGDRRKLWEAGKGPDGKGGGGDAFNASIGGSLLDQYKALAARGDTMGSQLLGGLRGGYGAINAQNRMDMQNLAKTFNKGMGRLDALGQGQEMLAGRYGAQRARQIREDADRAGRSGDQRIAAQLRGAGLGNSTILSAQQAGSRAGIERQAQRALQDAADASTDRQMAAGQNRIGTLGQMMSQRNAQIGGMYGAAADRQTNQQGALANVGQANIGRSLAQAQIPIDTMYALQQSQLFNPFLNQNMMQYNPGHSGLGAALSGAGNALGGIGGMMGGMGGGGGGGAGAVNLPPEWYRKG